MVLIRKGINVDTLTKKDIIEEIVTSANLDRKEALDGLETRAELNQHTE